MALGSERLINRPPTLMSNMAAPVGFEPFALLFFETVATKAPSSQASTGEPLTDLRKKNNF